jgi:hypothetical protein
MCPPPPTAASLRAFELSTAGVSEQPGDILEGVAALSDSIAREDRVAVLSRDRLLTRRGLGDLALNWTARDREVRAWRRQLQEVSAQVDSARRELAGPTRAWRITAASQDSTTLPDLRARTAQVIDELRLVDSALNARTTRVVDAELTLSEASSTIFAELHGLAAAQQEMRRNLLRIESPPLWKSVVATGSLSTSERGGLGTARARARVVRARQRGQADAACPAHAGGHAARDGRNASGCARPPIAVMRWASSSPSCDAPSRRSCCSASA